MLNTSQPTPRLAYDAEMASVRSKREPKRATDKPLGKNFGKQLYTKGEVGVRVHMSKMNLK